MAGVEGGPGPAIALVLGGGQGPDNARAQGDGSDKQLGCCPRYRVCGVRPRRAHTYASSYVWQPLPFYLGGGYHWFTNILFVMTGLCGQRTAQQNRSQTCWLGCLHAAPGDEGSM